MTLFVRASDAFGDARALCVPPPRSPCTYSIAKRDQYVVPLQRYA